jgi:cysteine-rich repeat protein
MTKMPLRLAATALTILSVSAAFALPALAGTRGLVADGTQWIQRAGISFGFHDDSQKTLEVKLGGSQGPTVAYNDPGNQGKMVSANAGKPEPETITIKTDAQNNNWLSNLADKIWKPFAMRASDDGGTVEYASRDGRVKDVYEPTATGLKHTAFYGWGNGSENETYSFGNAVLHQVADGSIQAFYLPSVDLSSDPKAKGADSGLLARASRTLTKERVEDFFANGGSNPSFIIPSPTAKDQHGKPIDASYRIIGDQHNQLMLSFSVLKDAYPVELDPTITTGGTGITTGSIMGESGSYFGSNLAIGDLNGDGKMDLVVGADYYNSNEGRVYVFFNDGSIPTTANTADFILTGETTSDYFSSSLAIGDLNGDSKADLAVGAYAHTNGGTVGGRIYVYYDNGDGTLGSTPNYTTGTALFTNNSTTVTGNGTTWTSAMAGRVIKNNANGIWYTISSASAHSITLSTAYAGSTTSSSAYTISGCSAFTNANVVITGQVSTYSEVLGQTLAIGDLNGNGKLVLAAGAQSYAGSDSSVYLFNSVGGGTFLSCGTTCVSGASSSHRIDSMTSSDAFGLSSLAIGDLNGDGVPDLAVGARGGNGTVYVFDNIETTCGPSCYATSKANTTITGDTSSSWFGQTLAIGDLNGDGHNDLAVGGSFYSTNTGKVFVYDGVGSGNFACGASCKSTTDASAIIAGEASNNYFAQTLAIGDLNDDGKQDLAVGAYNYTSNKGRAYIFYDDLTLYGISSCVTDYTTGSAVFNGTTTVTGTGGTTWTSAMVGKVIKNNTVGTWYPITAVGSTTSLTIATAGTAGTGAYAIRGCLAANADVIITGDSLSDFGWSLATGDLDYNGTTDLVVGAQYETTGTGAAYIYYDPILQTCGNSIVEGTEACDDGNTVTETSCAYGVHSCTQCDAACATVLNLTGPYCGDGIVNGTETCDDGNTTAGDGCSATCATESTYTCSGTPSVCTPPVAATPSPANYATGIVNGQQLGWAASARATSYDVYFGTSLPGTPNANQVGTSYTPGTLTPNTTYHWRIDGKNAAGTTTGTVWSFSTLALPAQAATPSPANSATGIVNGQQLGWGAATGATSYDVYFGTSTPGVFIGNQSGTGYNQGTLAAGTTYYWRIDSKNAAGTTTGTVWSFSTLALPAQAATPTPSNSATGIGLSQQLGWGAVSGATSYDVYFGTSSPGASKGSQTGLSYNPGTLTQGTPYYWRIDARNAFGATTGTVWSFTTQSCGNGITEGSEACDSGGLNGTPNHCNSSCTGTTGSACGNGVVESGEACDDGNTVTETSCGYGTATCTQCDATCSNVLHLAGTYCGDGTVQAGNGEACDDGNTSNGDGCTSSCLIEASWTCVNGKCVKSSFPTAAGSTNFAAVSNMAAVTQLKLATTQASVQWTAPVNASGQNLDQYVVVGTGFVSVDKAHLDPSLNATATMKVKVGSCADWRIWHSTVPVTSLSSLKALGTLVGSGQGASGSCTTYCSNPTCSGNTLTYTVTGFDGTGGEGAQHVGVSTTLGILNQPPAFVSGPSDGGSDGTNPTKVGDPVTFYATASDPNGDPYYVAICKTAAVTPHAGAAPTCDGGSWGNVTVATASGNAITPMSYIVTSSEMDETFAWYAYACDGNGAGGSSDPDHQCSAYAQGGSEPGTPGASPFHVDHRPVIGTVWVGNSYGSNNSVDPGGTVYVRAAVTDSDTDTTPDTISMYVCSTDAFAGGACESGKQLCTVGGISSGENADCSVAGIVPIPTAHGSYPLYVFLKDSHNFADDGTANIHNYSVTDVPPSIGTYTVNDISPVAGGSVDTSFTVTVTDNNGNNDITAVDGILYDTAAGLSLSSGDCPGSATNETNCYRRPACSLGTQSGALASLTATCDAITTWFDIDPTSPGLWKAKARATDQTGTVIGADSATDINVASLSAVAVAESSLAYGGIAVGGISAASLPATLSNVGNIPIDIGIHGSDMSDGGGHSIAASYQHWAVSSGFAYGISDHFLLVSETVPGNASQGCANESLAVRPAHGYSSSDTQLFWKLKIPALQPTGAYSGSDTFTSIVDGLCSGTD